MKAIFLLILLIPLAGCMVKDETPAQTGHSGTFGPAMDLNSWRPGWTLSYFSDKGHWENHTVLGSEQVERGDGVSWDTYRVNVHYTDVTDGIDNTTRWLDKATLGIVKETNAQGTSRNGCPIMRAFPLANTSYSCYTSWQGQGFGNVTLQHNVTIGAPVVLSFGTFNETIIRERSGPPFDHANWRAYSPEIGYYTRFREPNTEGGLNEEFRLVSARNRP